MGTVGTPFSSAEVEEGCTASRARIAIITVQGDVKQQRGAFAVDVASLLQSLPDARYSRFHEHPVYLPLHPVEIADREKALCSSVEATPISDPACVAHESMRMRLVAYKGAGEQAAYLTTRLEGQRSDGTRVDVFDVYSADLLRIAKGPWAFFGALYQLVLQVADLGRQAVDDAAREHRGSRTWRWISRMQAYAVRLLVLPIALLTAILLLGSLGPVVVRLLSDTAPVIASAMLGGIIGGAVAYALFHKTIVETLFERGLSRSAIPPVALIILGGGLGVALEKIAGPSQRPILTAVEWWLTGWALAHLVFRQYDRVRPGALWLGHLLYFACAAGFMWCLAASGAQHRAIYYPGAAVNLLPTAALGSVEQATLWTIQVEWVSLRALWFMLCFLAVVIALAGYVATRMHGDSGDTAAADARRGRARTALRTGRLVLAWSSIGVLLFTMVLWAGVFPYVARKSSAFQCLTLSIAPLPDWLERRVPEPVAFSSSLQLPPMAAESPCPGQPSVQQYFGVLFVLTMSCGLVGTLALAGAGLLLPSFSRGSDTTSAVAWLLWIAIFVIPPASVVGLHGSSLIDLPPFLASGFRTAQRLTTLNIGTIAAVTAAAAVLIAIVANVGSSRLGAMLSVDNYLRALPGDDTPRARIAERYVSLLRHIASVGIDDEEPTPYTGVVIVARDLGALISTDLLGFLRHEAEAGPRQGDVRLTRLGYGPGGEGAAAVVYLFTMGTPMQETLSRFFPHQYRSVRESPNNGVSVVPSTSPEIAPALHSSPVACHLGIAQQMDNGYRSAGDSGALRHRWCHAAPEIAQRVDALVDLVASRS